jgi:hypothetical protein
MGDEDFPFNCEITVNNYWSSRLQGGTQGKIPQLTSRYT